MNPLMIVFVLALLLVGGAMFILLQLSAKERQSEVQMRLRVLGGDEASAILTPYKPRDAALGNPILRGACHLLWRTGIEIEPASVSKILMVSALLLPVALIAFGVFGGLAVCAVLGALGWGFLARRAAAIRAKMMEQMPGFLESAMRVLAAGNTLEESIAAAAKESPEPLRPLMMSVGRQVRLGAPVETVLMEAGEIHRLRDVKVMALAASINRKYGGSLKNILKSLIQSIRQRDVAARELRALTAETRFSAVIMALVPTSLSLYIYLQNPQYYGDMWNDGGGKAMLILSLAMQVIGIFVIMRMMARTGDDA